jgi:hypothetical protein
LHPEARALHRSRTLNCYQITHLDSIAGRKARVLMCNFYAGYGLPTGQARKHTWSSTTAHGPVTLPYLWKSEMRGRGGPARRREGQPARQGLWERHGDGEDGRRDDGEERHGDGEDVRDSAAAAAGRGERLRGEMAEWLRVGRLGHHGPPRFMG